MAAVLLAARATVDAVDGDGRSALHGAARWDHPPLLAALLAAGAAADAVDAATQTPLDVARSAGADAAVAVLRARSAGADGAAVAFVEGAAAAVAPRAGPVTRSQAPHR